MTKTLEREIVEVADGAGDRLAETFGAAPGGLRLSFVSGPGDVVGSYRHWRQGRMDPGVPSVAYSPQFYELVTKLGASAQVVTVFAPPEETGEAPRMTFTQVTRAPWSGRLDYFRSQAAYARDVCAQVAAYDPHVVIASTNFPSSGWARLKRGRRLVLSAHNTFWPMGRPPAGLKAQLKLGLLKARARAVDGAVCTSPECARQIAAVTGGRVQGLVEHTQIVRAYPQQARSRVRRMLYLGRIETDKGVFLLLDVFVALKQRFPDLSLTFAGAGSADAALRRAIAAVDVPDIHFPGRLDAAGVHDAIAGTDLVVCPTTSGFDEGLALVGLEAAAHGIPSVVSTVVPALDVLGAGCRTFRADDAGDLERVLAELISDPAAYARVLDGIRDLRPRLYDPALSWGTQLGRLLAALA